jgi:phenol/toluene 2-monooxygenase (NADH) P3/A3
MLAPSKQFLGLKARYAAMTQGLDWETSYQAMDDVFPQQLLDGIKIHDWSRWQDPFRLTMDAYWKYQSEKEKRLYAVIEAFAQNNGHLGVADARYINSLKVFLQCFTPLEYYTHRGFAHLGRQLRGPSARVAAQLQSVDELRHFQTQTHSLSLFNRYFNGLHSAPQWFDNGWYQAVPKSFFEDAYTGGPFEFLTAISFSFEYVLTNLLFVPFMSGAAHNGDMSTVTVGFSAQSDESRHMTLGVECIRFLLEQDPDNAPIVQRWIDKWFWRGYRLLTLVAMMQDYMLPRRVMSWKEAWEMYAEQAGGALYRDLARYGIREPKGWKDACEGKDHISHQAWSAFYQYSQTTAFHTFLPNDEELAWLSEKYPSSFARRYRPRLDHFKQRQGQGRRFANKTLPMVCSLCQFPMIFTEPGNPGRISLRRTQYREESFNFCSQHCKEIFEAQPEKYLQAHCATHAIYKDRLDLKPRGPSLPEQVGPSELFGLTKRFGLNDGQDNGEFEGSQDQRNFDDWRGDAIEGAHE